MDYGTRWPYLQIGKGTIYDLILVVIGRLIQVDLGRIAYTYRLEGHELQFTPCRHCRLAYKDDTPVTI